MENVNLDLRKRMFLSERTIILVYVAVEKNYLPLFGNFLAVEHRAREVIFFFE